MSDFLDIKYFFENSLIGYSGLSSVNRFMCNFNKIPLDFINEAKVINMAYPPSIDKTLRLHVLDVTCPSINLSEGQNIELNGSKRFYFKERNDSDLKITFLDTPDLTVRTFFYSWIQAIANITTDKGVKRKYLNQYTAQSIELMPLNHYSNPIQGDYFENVCPFNIDMLNYSYERHDIIKTSVEFKYMFHKISLDANYYFGNSTAT